MKQFFIVALLLLSSCAGTPFEWKNAKAIHIGTTQAELISSLGKPYMVKTQGEEQTWIWSYANGVTGETQLVSYVLKNGAVTVVPTIVN
jgi:hypothetical protein